MLPQTAHVDFSHRPAVRRRVAAEIKAVCEHAVVLGQKQDKPSWQESGQNIPDRRRDRGGNEQHPCAHRFPQIGTHRVIVPQACVDAAFHRIERIFVFAQSAPHFLPEKARRVRQETVDRAVRHLCHTRRREDPFARFGIHTAAVIERTTDGGFAHTHRRGKRCYGIVFHTSSSLLSGFVKCTKIHLCISCFWYMT